MEQLLAIVVFGVLIAVTVFGYIRTEREAKRRGRGDFSQSSAFAQVSSRDEQRASPSG